MENKKNVPTIVINKNKRKYNKRKNNKVIILVKKTKWQKFVSSIKKFLKIK